MSKDKTRARDTRLHFVARAASTSGLATGVEGFPPSDNRVIVRLEREDLIDRHRAVGRTAWRERQTITIFHATPAGLDALAAANLSPSGALPACDPRPTGQISRSWKLRASRTKLRDRLASAERAELVRGLGAQVCPIKVKAPTAGRWRYLVWKAFVHATDLNFSWADFQKHFTAQSTSEPDQYIIRVA